MCECVGVPVERIAWVEEEKRREEKDENPRYGPEMTP
jgi:hypothetical protein